MNTVALVGRITDAGPRLRYLDNGKCELSLTLLVQEQGRDQGTYRTFIPIQVVGAKCELLAEALEPSDLIAVVGKLAYKKMKRKDGMEESRLIVVSFDATVLVRADADTPVTA